MIEDIAEHLKKQEELIPKVSGVILEAYKRNKKGYTDKEIIIINTAEDAYKEIFDTTESPLHFQCVSDDQDSKKYPKLDLAGFQFRPDITRVGSSKITDDCYTSIIKLTNYCGKYQEKMFTGEFKATSHIILFIIDALYALSHADINKISTLQQIERYIIFIERMLDVIENHWHENDEEKLIRTLSDICLNLYCTKQVVVEMQNCLGAKEYLDTLSIELENICCYGFKYLLRVISIEEVSIDVDLKQIKGAKILGKEDALQKFIQPVVEERTIDEFNRGFSKSLITLLYDDELDASNLFINKACHSFLHNNQGIYKLTQDRTFRDTYLYCCKSLEMLALLFRCCIQGKNVVSGMGQINYFLVHKDTAMQLTQRVEDVLNSFFTKYEEIKHIVRDRRHHNNLNANDAKENIKWNNSLKSLRSTNYDTMLDLSIKKANAARLSLLQLQRRYTEHTQKQIDKLIRDSNKFKITMTIANSLLLGQFENPGTMQLSSATPQFAENEKPHHPQVSSFKGNLTMFSTSSTIPLFKAVENVQPCLSSLIPALFDKINDNVIIKWHFYSHNKAVEFVNCNETLKSIKNGCLSGYLDSEKALIAMIVADNTEVNILAKSMQQLYSKNKDLENELMRVQTSLEKNKSNDTNRCQINFILHIRNELIFRQLFLIKHVIDKLPFESIFRFRNDIVDRLTKSISSKNGDNNDKLQHKLTREQWLLNLHASYIGLDRIIQSWQSNCVNSQDLAVVSTVSAAEVRQLSCGGN